MSDEIPRAAVPADVGAPDQIAWGLTFRQLGIIGGGALAGWMLYGAFGQLLPAVVWLVGAVPAAGLTVAVALGRRDGLPLDVWLRHGLMLRRTPPVQVAGRPRRGVPLVDVAGQPPQLPAPLRSPVTAISADGTLTVDGVARQVIACGTTNIALRTGAEQGALLDGFGRWLNALTTPAQIVVAAQRHDLRPYADAVHTASARLPHPALQAAAADYAAFLLELDATRDPLRRQVLAAVPGGHVRDTTTRALSALGVSTRLLDGAAVTAALAGAVDPFDPPTPGPRAAPGTPITAERRI